MTLKPVVVVGSVNLDMVCTCRRMPSPGETVGGKNFQMFEGGKGANQSVAIARLGYPVAFIAKVGDDGFGTRLRAALKGAGVSVKAVSVARGVSSGVATILADEHGQNSIVVVPGANGVLRPSDLDRATPLLRSAGMILTQLEVPIETVEYLARLASKFDLPLMLDPSPARSLRRHLLKNITYLTPNETEANSLCGNNGMNIDCSNASVIARKLLENGPRNIIIKMGKLGSYFSGHENGELFVPAFKVRAVDSTAAGDAFNGGLAVALMKGNDIVHAARFASAVAALSVQRKGAQPSLPTARQVQSFLRKLPVLEPH
jgi:ribokinase